MAFLFTPRDTTGKTSWIRSKAAGYLTWAGRFANDASSHGVELDGYALFIHSESQQLPPFFLLLDGSRVVVGEQSA